MHRVPPTALVLGAVASVQIGAAIAKGLFDDAGPAGTVLLRVGFAALALWLVWRPRPLAHSRRDLLLAAAFGITLGGINIALYQALDRIPLGVAVASTRRALDALWVVLAAAGILLLADPGGGSVDAAGIALALLAGVFWAAYILVNERVGRVFPGGGGLALAMAVAALLLLPGGVTAAGEALLDPRILAIGAAVAMLSSAIPYSLELEALRRIPAGVFGVLMSLEPAVAALAGLAILGEVLAGREWAGIALVVAASAGATRRARVARPLEG